MNLTSIFCNIQSIRLTNITRCIMTRKNKKKDSNSSGKTIYKGVIDITRTGLGYVKVEGLDKDIIVKRDHLSNALNGDEVRIEVTTRGRKFGARPEGVVVDIIRRKQ